MKNFILVFLFSITMFSCQEEVIVQLPTEENVEFILEGSYDSYNTVGLSLDKVYTFESGILTITTEDDSTEFDYVVIDSDRVLIDGKIHLTQFQSESVIHYYTKYNTEVFEVLIRNGD